MSSLEPAPLSLGRSRPSIVAVVLGVCLVAAVGCQLVLSGHGQQHPTATATEPPTADLGEADGVLPDGVTVFDVEYPGVAELDPDLLRALHGAATAAADDGVGLVVNSGWRSAAYQAQLLREAVSEHGSERAAARWAATPRTSSHVTGDAVDIGHVEARIWLSDHGAQYGLCQIYDNEPWHYELRPDAVEHGCPPTYADPTHDPRMQ